MIILPLILATGVFTYYGLRDFRVMDRFIFDVGRIRTYKESYRLLSSGFLHANWFHFGFNMITLFYFSQSFQHGLAQLGEFFLIFLGGIVAGSGLSLYFNRNNSSYRALGASGGVSAVVFGYIAQYPTSSFHFLFLPFEFPAWALGLVFVVLSIVGVKRKWGNIGHDAHLGGAIFGMLISVLFHPSIVVENWWAILLCLVPFAAFMWLVLTRPESMIIPNYTQKQVGKMSKQFRRQQAVREQLNRNPQEELDSLLEKVGKKGIKSLTKEERKRLDELSKRY